MNKSTNMESKEREIKKAGDEEAKVDMKESD